MARFVKGEIVVVPFPFSDLTQTKRRPALVISTLEGDDLILCQITSQKVKDNYEISIDDTDFDTGDGGMTSLRTCGPRPATAFQDKVTCCLKG